MGGSDRERAIEELRRLLELDDGFWLAHFALGNIYSATGMMQQAIVAPSRKICRQRLNT